MTDQDVLARFPWARKLIALARERGALAPDDELEAFGRLLKLSPGGTAAFGLLWGGGQRTGFLFVTHRHVIFTGWSLEPWGLRKAFAETLRIDRPAQLEVSKQRVELPSAVAGFLGRQTVYAGPPDKAAGEALRIARTPVA